MENPKHMENTLASSSGTVSPEDQGKNTTTESKCPFNHAASASTNRDWWPNQVSLKVLHQHSTYPIRWARSSITPRNSRVST